MQNEEMSFKQMSRVMSQDQEMPYSQENKIHLMKVQCRQYGTKNREVKNLQLWVYQIQDWILTPLSLLLRHSMPSTLGTSISHW
jgi:hypothetical protein